MRMMSILSQLKKRKTRDRRDRDWFDDRYERRDHYDRDRFDRENCYDKQWRDDRDNYDRHRRYDAYDDDYNSKINPKVYVLEFESTFYVDDFLDWLNSVERSFEYYNVLEHKKVKLVAIKSRQHASFLWKISRSKELEMGKVKLLRGIRWKGC